MTATEWPTPQPYEPTPTVWVTPTGDLPAAKSSTPTMVVGIVGAVLGVLAGWFLPLIPFGLGVVGLSLTAGRPKDGQRTAGLVLGVINTVLGGVGTLFWLFFVVLVAAGSAS